jgi:hypothetical protein
MEDGINDRKGTKIPYFPFLLLCSSFFPSFSLEERNIERERNKENERKVNIAPI